LHTLWSWILARVKLPYTALKNTQRLIIYTKMAEKKRLGLDRAVCGQLESVVYAQHGREPFGPEPFGFELKVERLKAEGLMG
jgi:hypothetical protein